MSGKKIAILFGLMLFGAFMGVQVITGFPIIDLFVKESVTEEVQVEFKQDDRCIVSASDHPRDIEDCPYSVGDHVMITYNRDNAGILSHSLAN